MQSQAFELLRDNYSPVAICESQLPDGARKEVLSQLSLMACPPALVVASRLADEALWAEVLNLGGYNVLAKPLDRKEVIHVLGHAWLLGNCQQPERSPHFPQ